MPRRTNEASLEVQIQKAEAKVKKAQLTLDKAIEELDVLLEKKQELEAKIILKAIRDSGKTVDEILRLIRL